MKKVLCFILSIVLITGGFAICPLKIHAGTDPEPVILLPTDDAEINNSSTAAKDKNYNYGTSAGSTEPGTVGEMYTRKVSTAGSHIVYMKFDISSINISEINDAVVRIYAKNSRANIDYLNVYAVEDTAWTETAITWNNAPVTDFSTYTPISSFQVDAQMQKNTYRYYEIDVKDYIIDWYYEGKTHITLAFQPMSQHAYISIQSKDLIGGYNDGPNPPCLFINKDLIPPSPPQNVNAEALTEEAIMLTWEAATDNTSIYGYEIYMDGEKIDTVGADVLSYTCSGLQVLTEYSFYIIALDSSKNPSDPSETVTAATLNLEDHEPPAIPQNLAAKVLSNSKIRLTWQPSTDNVGIAGYIIYCNDTEIARPGADEYLGYEVTELSEGTEYTFSVEAIDLWGNVSGKSVGVTATTLSGSDGQPPEKPENLQLSDIMEYSSNATLSWEPSPDNFETTGYIVYVNGGEKARVSAPSASYQFTDLTPYTEYSIYVKAFDEAGNISEASDTLTVTTNYVVMRTAGTGGQYPTIQEALNVANPGDVILIKDGSYTGSITISRSGTSSRWITIMAEGTDAQIHQGHIVVNASYIRVSGIKIDGGLVNIKKPFVQSTNMDIRNAGGGFYLEGSAGNVYLADNYIYKCRNGIFSRGDNNIFERNEIEYLDKNGESGDVNYFTIFGSNIIVRNNYCHGTVFGPHLGTAHVDFVQSYDEERRNTKNVLIENNIVTGFYHQGFMLENDANPGSYYISDWIIRNNVISGYHSWAVNAGKTNGGIPNIVIENNLFIGDPNGPDKKGAYHGVCIDGKGGYGIIRNNIIMNSGDGYYATDQSVLIEHGNNLTYNTGIPYVVAPSDIIGVDPLLVDPYNPENPDFHLHAASPAIDSGAEVNFLYDLEGNPRPSGNGFDIGPYEFQGIKANTPPMITIVSPAENAVYDIGSDVEITVTAKDDQSVEKVEYYLNGEKIGESAEAPFNYTIQSIQEGIHTLYAIAYDSEGLFSKSNDASFISSDSEVLVVGSSFINLTIPEQHGIANVIFDAIPMVNKMNGVMGVTFGEASAPGNLAAIVRFNPDGLIDAFKGDKTPPYTYDNEVPYSALEKYRFRMAINIPQGLFSVSVTDEEGDIHVVAENYPFSTTGVPGTVKLDTIAGISEAGSYILLFDPESNIPEQANSVIISENSLELIVGDTRTLTATVLPENAANRELVWESSNPYVATVDQNGMVTAISAGTATITVKVAGTEIQDTCTVTVQLAQTQGITITVPDEVAPEKNFSATIGFNLDKTILTAGFTVTYNPDLVTYKGCDAIDGGLSLAGVKHDKNAGTIRILLSGTPDPITSGTPLVKINFRSTKTEGYCEIAVTDAELLDEPGNSTLPAQVSKTVRVNKVIPGDANDDGVINLRDLHFVSTHFWKDTTSPDWDIVKAADFNNDGRIGIEDLVYVASKILN